jgi:hypothetical protein
MEFVQKEPEDISNEDIRERYASGKRGRYTEHFVATENGQDVGFLAVDIEPETKYLVIYNIFVPISLRRQGIGGRILKAAENMGRDRGYDDVALTPRTLDDRFPQLELECWYKSEGYQPLPGYVFNEHGKSLKA